MPRGEVIIGRTKARVVVPSGRTVMHSNKGMGVKKPMTAVLKRMDNLLVDGSMKKAFPMPHTRKGFLDLDLKNPIGKIM